MTATTDFIHAEEIIDAIIVQLDANLPAAWTSGENSILRLRRLEFGDLSDYALSTEEKDEWPDSVCPSIFVDINRSADNPPSGGIGGKQGVAVPIRVIYVFSREQSVDLADPEAWIQPSRARCQRAKVVNKALFTHRKLGDLTMTTDDTNARVVDMQFVAVQYDQAPAIDPQMYPSIAIDVEVITRTQ